LLDLNLKEIYNDYLTEIELDNKELYKKKNPNKYYRASAAGHCFKKHWYSINGYEGKGMDDRSKRLLRLGTIVHEDIQKAIELYQSNNLPSKDEEVLSQEYNINFKTEYQIVIESLNVMGSADIVVLDSENTASVIDIKTTHSWKWKMMFGRNREPKPSRMYELQLGTYALGIIEQEEIEYDDISLYLVYYKKDDSMMKPINVNNVWMDNAAEYWSALNETLDMVKDENDLPRNSLNVPIENWECKYCQFEPICN
jgi:CRISPR/Cas system-associated exonuclease Cas4 (RecB family)